MVWQRTLAVRGYSLLRRGVGHYSKLQHTTTHHRNNTCYCTFSTLARFFARSVALLLSRATQRLADAHRPLPDGAGWVRGCESVRLRSTLYVRCSAHCALPTVYAAPACGCVLRSEFQPRRQRGRTEGQGSRAAGQGRAGIAAPPPPTTTTTTACWVSEAGESDGDGDGGRKKATARRDGAVSGVTGLRAPALRGCLWRRRTTKGGTAPPAPAPRRRCCGVLLPLFFVAVVLPSRRRPVALRPAPLGPLPVGAGVWVGTIVRAHLCTPRNSALPHTARRQRCRREALARWGLLERGPRRSGTGTAQPCPVQKIARAFQAAAGTIAGGRRQQRRRCAPCGVTPSPGNTDASLRCTVFSGVRSVGGDASSRRWAAV